MSTDQYVVCHKCKVSIQVASYGLGGFRFYRGEPGCMRALHAFLEEHLMHSDKVGFAPEQHYEDYKEVEWPHSAAPGEPTRDAVREAVKRHVRAAAAHIKENADALKAFDWEHNEARCRELCAMYLEEIALTMDMGDRLAELSRTTMNKSGDSNE
jgi:hypothetical protein